MNSSSLHPAHLEDLRRSALTDETIQAAGVYTVSPGERCKRPPDLVSEGMGK